MPRRPRRTLSGLNFALDASYGFEPTFLGQAAGALVVFVTGTYLGNNDTEDSTRNRYVERLLNRSWRGATAILHLRSTMSNIVRHVEHDRVTGGAGGHRHERSDPVIRARLAGAALRASALTPVARGDTHENQNRGSK